MRRLAAEMVSLVPQLTVQRSVESVLSNAEANLLFIEHTVADLSDGLAQIALPALAVAAGPSLHRRNQAALIREQYGGKVIAADGALGYCLRNGVVPDYVVALDPHPTRIVRWFGDTDLAHRSDDDYFRRQDLDPHHHADEVAANRELIDLVNAHGPQIKAIISTSVSPAVAKRCLEAGMTLYWWNPILDDVSDPNSATRTLFNMNRAPCLVSGGNVGTASWVIAHQVLGASQVILLGMDLSYPPGTPMEQTQYFKEMEELLGDHAADAFISIYNPHLRETWFTDPAYFWYRESLLEMAAQASCVTYNCTEGGILFGSSLQFASLEEVLSKPYMAGKGEMNHG